MKASAWTKQDVIVTGLCVVFIVVTVHAVATTPEELANRMRCATHLSGLGKAMLIYSNDYEDELPKAGGRRNQWVPALPKWCNANRREAYGIDRKGSGKATITSSLYLLVKYAEVTPKQFVCPSDVEAGEFKLSRVPEELPQSLELIDAWDFGGGYDAKNNPSRHCSYAYHMPFGNYALTIAHEPQMGVLADRNPWLNPKRVSDPDCGWEAFKSASSNAETANAKNIGNSDTHQRDGQNVLFLDAHVAFERQLGCAVEKDNIYTIATDETESGRAIGRMPKLYQAEDPLNRRDSVLVQDAGPVVADD